MAELIGSGQLPVGTKILWETVTESRTVSLGFFFPTGSRYDFPGKNGTAHFVEHMLFKGTRSFSAQELARTIDRVGGDINAYTDREEVAFLCTVPAEAWKTAAEVLFELCFEPTFPVDEFEREREVIRSEILSAQEEPEELSYETFLQLLSPKNRYALPVAGTDKSLSQILADDVRSWWESLVRPENLTVAMAGPVDSREFQHWMSERFERLTPRKPQAVFEKAIFQPNVFFKQQKASFQTTQLIGGVSLPKNPSWSTAFHGPWFSLLWGESMSSRLFQNIRENLGLCYSISSQYFEGEDTAGLHFFASCSPENAPALVAALREEIDALRKSPPSRLEWEDARQALRGGILISSEKMENRVQRLVHHEWSFSRLYTIDESLETVKGLKSNLVWDGLKELFVRERSSLLVWGRWKEKEKGELGRIWSD